MSPDVYSYDEDDMVLDPKLPEHLAHFGIDMMTMEKVGSRTPASTSPLRRERPAVLSNRTFSIS